MSDRFREEAERLVPDGLDDCGQGNNDDTQKLRLAVAAALERVAREQMEADCRAVCLSCGAGDEAWLYQNAPNWRHGKSGASTYCQAGPIRAQGTTKQGEK